MPALTQREKRTIRLAVAAVAIYLVLFFGVRGWRSLESRRAEYQRLLVEAQRLKRDLQPYENRALLAQKLKDTFRIHPQKLSRATLVAEASAAIQNAAKSGGIQLGPMRESPARSSAKELTSMQLEGNGSVAAVIALLYRLQTVGYPLIIDSLQITPDPKPGKVKVNMTIVILDYDQWKKEEAPRA